MPYVPANHFDQICLSCGRRFGEHYGHDDEHRCDRYNDYVGPYAGRYWVPSGVFSKERGKSHWGLLKPEPNYIFKGKKGL